MASQDVTEVLKVLASICTPLSVALSGLFINRSIQRQNASAQRESSWLTKWSDDFLKVSSDFNDSATEFLMTYWWLSALDMNKHLEGIADDPDGRSANVSHYRDLVRTEWRMLKFADLAPLNGKKLEEAAKALVEEAGNWSRNRGGNVSLFREKQAAFNKNVRRVHAELLRLDHLK